MNSTYDIFIKSYGCSFNRFRSQRLAELLNGDFSVYNQSYGSDRSFFRDAEEESVACDAGYVVVYTCPITGYLEKLSDDFIRHIKEINPVATVIVTGCSVPDTDSSLKTGRVVFLPDADVAGYLGERNGSRARKNVRQDTSGSIGTLLIKAGCGNGCTYCICPRSNRVENVPFADIRTEINRLIGRGFTTIEFGGPCVGDWVDPETKAFTFSDLLGYVLSETHLNIANLELYPTDFTDDLIALLTHERIDKDISIPIQSGSDTMLGRMGRKYTKARLEKILDMLFSTIPNAHITTDIIVGSPNETRNDLKETLDLLKRYDFSRIDTYMYSATRSADTSARGNSRDSFLELLGTEKYHDLAKKINLTSR